jgi:hypothetical protein
MVGTVKKSIAAITSRWFLRKINQSLRASPLWPTRTKHRDTVRSEISKPNFSSSPWILGAPQVGLSFAMRAMR